MGYHRTIDGHYTLAVHLWKKLSHGIHAMVNVGVTSKRCMARGLGRSSSHWAPSWEEANGLTTRSYRQPRLELHL